MSCLDRTARNIAGTDDYGKKFLWIPQFLLQLIYMWPEQKNIFYRKIMYILALCIYIFYGFGIAHKLIKSQDLDEILDQTVSISVYFHATTKATVLYFYKDQFKAILYDLRHKFWPHDLLGNKLREEIKSIYKSVTFVMLFHAITACIFVINTSVKSWIHRRYPFTISYPIFDVDNPLVYLILCLGQIFSMVFQLTVLILGCDHLFFTLTFSIIVQYKILQNVVLLFNMPKMSAVNAKLRLIGNDRLEEIYRDENREFFVRCVQHHQLLLRVIKKINILFVWVALPQVITTVCTVCGVVFKIANEDISAPAQKVLAVIMIMNILTELGLFCLMGNELHYQASLLPEYIFHANWHGLSSNEFKKDFKFLLQRSQDIPNLNAYHIYVFNLDFFIRMLKLTFSMYTFVTTIKPQ